MLTAGAAYLSGPDAYAYELETTASGAPVRWRQDSIAVEIAVDDDAPGLAAGAAAAAAGRALETWSASAGPLLFPAAADEPEGAPMAIRLATGPDDPGVGRRELALTHLHYDAASGAIGAVEVVVNAHAFRWTAEDACAGAYDLESTLAHEVGHALGLRHSRDPAATMYTAPAPCETGRRDLAEDDLAGIAAIYGEQAGADGDGEPADAPRALGCSAGRSAGATAGASDGASGGARSSFGLALALGLLSLRRRHRGHGRRFRQT